MAKVAVKLYRHISLAQIQMHVVVKSLVASAIICVAFALACQSSAPTATPRIQPEDIVVETRPTATPLPTEVSLAPSPTVPSRVATVTPNPTFEALRATATPLPTPSPTPDIAKLRDRLVFRLPISNIVVPDPVFADFGESSTLQYEIFAGLTTFTTDNSDPVLLDMAANHSISRDGLSHTFVLREGLLFSDGSPVTASDFKWSWERALRTAAQVEVATQAEWVLAPILGASEVLAGEASELAGVTAVDETTLTIELTAPRYDLTALLAHPSAAVLKRENVEGWTIDWSTRPAGLLPEPFSADSGIGDESLPVGTGPFTLTRFDEDNELYIAERNDYYHGEPPQIDAVRFDARSHSQAMEHEDGYGVGLQHLFEIGEIDLGNAPSPLDPEDESAVPFNLAPVDSIPRTQVLVFNPSIPPFDDVNFRRALAASIDRESIAPDYGGDEATGIVAPDAPGYSESSMPIEFDLNAARASMDTFRQANPRTVDTIVWSYGFSGWFEAERKEIASSWERELSLDFRVENAFIDDYQRLRNDNKLTIAYYDHIASYPHPQSSVIDFQEIFGESLASDDIDAVNDMVQAAASERDPVIALQLYAEVEQHLLDNALVVPLWEQPSFEYENRVQQWVHGYAVGRYGGSRCKNVWFDETYPGPR